MISYAKQSFFKLNAFEHEISTDHKNLELSIVLVLKESVVFILLINVKMPTIVGILTFMSWIKFMLL